MFGIGTLTLVRALAGLDLGELVLRFPRPPARATNPGALNGLPADHTRPGPSGTHQHAPMIRRGGRRRTYGVMPNSRTTGHPAPSVAGVIDALYAAGCMGAFEVAEHFGVEMSRARVLLLSAQARSLACADHAGEYRLTRRGNDAAAAARLATDSENPPEREKSLTATRESRDDAAGARGAARARRAGSTDDRGSGE